MNAMLRVYGFQKHFSKDGATREQKKIKTDKATILLAPTYRNTTNICIFSLHGCRLDMCRRQYANSNDCNRGTAGRRKWDR